jgi:type IX secretion system PorP/SprF family membrane protein
MIKNLTLSFCTLCFVFTAARAQDIHFTLYDMVPLMFNPGQTGAFSGSYRVAGIYRDQWVSVTGAPNEFKTPGFSVDVPLIKGFRDNDWVGVGVIFYSDKSGSLGLQNSAFKLSAAYHFALDKKGNTVLSLGYQTGSVQRRIKANGLEKIDLLEMDPSLTPGTELMSSFTDHVGGLHLRTKMNNQNVFRMGVSVSHIGKSDISLSQGGGGGGQYKLPMRFLGSASLRSLLTDRVAIVPSAFVQVQGKDHEIVGQAVLEYLFNPEKDVVMRGGLGYRVGDAVQILLGARIRELTIMAGYDMNVSRLSPASSTVGGFELSASLVGIIYKKPDPDPVLFCPRF